MTINQANRRKLFVKNLITNSILINKILMDHDQALILAICISAPLYLSILAKFIYDYSRFIYYLLYCHKRWEPRSVGFPPRAVF